MNDLTHLISNFYSLQVPERSGFFDIWEKVLYRGTMNVLTYDPNVDNPKWSFVNCELPPGKYEIIGKGDELIKIEFEKIVGRVPVKLPLVILDEWKDYEGGENWATSFSSFKSLLKSKNLNPSTTLIIRKIN